MLFYLILATFLKVNFQSFIYIFKTISKVITPKDSSRHFYKIRSAISSWLMKKFGHGYLNIPTKNHALSQKFLQELHQKFQQGIPPRNFNAFFDSVVIYPQISSKHNSGISSSGFWNISLRKCTKRLWSKFSTDFFFLKLWKIFLFKSLPLKISAATSSRMLPGILKKYCSINSW